MSKSKLTPTKNSLPAKTREKSVALLNQALADLSDLYSQTKQAHWNVRGKRFFQLHKLFDELAELVEKHLDTIAERATSLGGYAEGTVRMAAASSRLKEWPTNTRDEDKFVQELIARFAAAANSVRDSIDSADDAGDADTADLFTAVSRDLDEALWFLEAHE